jgi:hypothetical protein
VPAHGVRVPRGEPLVTVEQVPGTARLQAWHWPPHGESQQTPSTQFPVSQTSPGAQLSP